MGQTSRSRAPRSELGCLYLSASELTPLLLFQGDAFNTRATQLRDVLKYIKCSAASSTADRDWVTTPKDDEDDSLWRMVERSWTDIFPPHKAPVEMLGHPRVWADVVFASSRHHAKVIPAPSSGPSDEVVQPRELDDFEKAVAEIEDAEYLTLMAKQRPASHSC